MPNVHNEFSNGQVNVSASCRSRSHIVRMRFGERGQVCYYRFSAPGKGWGNYLLDSEGFECNVCGAQGIYCEVYRITDSLCQRCRSAASGSASG